MSNQSATIVLPRPAVTKPPRINCAGFCTFCVERGCESPKCVERWEASRWEICPDCDGVEAGCCLFGVVEVWPN